METRLDVLRAILSIGGDANAFPTRRNRAPSPQASDLLALCDLLAAETPEEDLQKYFERNPGYLTALYGSNDNTDLAVLYKPYVGTQYRADFCVLQAFQGGSVAHLIEIESCHERLFTKALTPARRLQGALGQVEDWQSWIETNAQHYARELVRMAQGLPMFGDSGDTSKGLRFAEKDDVENIWKAFGGFEAPSFSYGIIIGRWSTLMPEERIRLVERNRRNQGLSIFTFEQLARQANYRDARDEF